MKTAMRIIVVGAVWAMASGALGQDAPLKGPTVTQDRPAGLGAQFAEGKEDRKGPMNERIPMRVYAQAVEKLRGDEVPEGLRLTADQDAKIHAIESEFRATMQEYMRNAREQQGANAKGGDGASEEQRRQRTQELMRNAPDPTSAQVKVYALLSPDQKKFVEAEVAKSQQELSKRRADEYAQRLLQRRKGEGKPGKRAVEAAGPELRERAQRVVDRIQQLPPEEREQVLRRLEEELDRRAAARGDAPGMDPVAKPAAEPNPKP
jgi:hypothetical protein